MRSDDRDGSASEPGAATPFPARLDIAANAGSALVRHGRSGVSIHAIGGGGDALAEIALAPTPAPAFVAVDFECVVGAVELRLDTARGSMDAARIDRLADAGPATVTLEAARIEAGDRVVVVGCAHPGAPTIIRIGDVRVTPARSVASPVVNESPDTLMALYDMRGSPCGLAFAAFLLHAEQQRRATGKERIHVALLPEEAAGALRLPAGYDAAFDAAARAGWLHSMLPGLCELVPSVAAVTVHEDRQALLGYAERREVIFPERRFREPGSPAPILASIASATQPGAPRLQAPGERRDRVRGWLSELAAARPVVVFLMRFEDHVPEINSDVDAWREAAERLDARVVAVPDPRRPDEPAPAGPWVPFPWHDVVSLQALYELADVTVAAFGEMAYPLMLGDAPYVLWVPADDAIPDVSTQMLDLFHAHESLPHAVPGDREVRFGRPSPDDLVTSVRRVIG